MSVNTLNIKSEKIKVFGRYKISFIIVFFNCMLFLQFVIKIIKFYFMLRYKRSPVIKKHLKKIFEQINGRCIHKKYI